MAKKTSEKTRKVKAFSTKKFIKLAKELKAAVKREEKKYGSFAPIP